MTIKFPCTFCGKESHFDPAKVQQIVDLMESQGQTAPTDKTYHVQCEHCQRWQEVKPKRKTP